MFSTFPKNLSTINSDEIKFTWRLRTRSNICRKEKYGQLLGEDICMFSYESFSFGYDLEVI